VTLSGLALLWASAAMAYILLASSRTGMATAVALAAGEATTPPSLSSADGVWMAALLVGATLMSGLPFGISLVQPEGLRATAWTVGLLLLGFCLVTGVSVGLLYLPSAILLLVAGTCAMESRA
jgi:hypothetical protein